MNEARLRAAEAAEQVVKARLATAEEQARAAVAEAEYWSQQLRREQGLAKSRRHPQERVARTRSEADRTAAARRAAETS